MDFCYFVGIDISKDTLDWAVYTQQQGILLSIQTDNTLKGIRSALVQLKALPGWNSAQAVFCQEHTGIVRHEVARFEYG
ncbi:IS110 family transposase [Spirosoma endophyticum]|nr:IS110 family transposase [Spirosoma endophyticum]